MLLYFVPLIVIIIILKSKKSDTVNWKSVMKSVGVSAACIILYLVLGYAIKFLPKGLNLYDNAVSMTMVAMLVDVIFQISILFFEAVIFRKIFNLSGKLSILPYITLVVCLIVSGFLYYIDFIDTFRAIASGISNSSLLESFDLLTAECKFALLRTIISIIPAIVVIIESFELFSKKK